MNFEFKLSALTDSGKLFILKLVGLLVPSVPNHMSRHACLSQVQKVHSAICAMSNFVEQRSTIKFCLRNDISAAEMYRMLHKAFGDETMSQKSVYKWYRGFKEGREHVDDLQRSERPLISIYDQNIN